MNKIPSLYPQNKPIRQFKFIKFLLIFCLIGFLVYNGLSYYHLTHQKFSLKLEIKKNDNLYKIKKQLCQKLNTSCLSLDLFIYFHKTSIKPGTYKFSGENLENIFKQLNKGPKQKYVKFTILPGRTKFDIASRISGLKTGLQDGKQDLQDKRKQIAKIFLDLMENKKFIKKLKTDYPQLEKFGDFKSLEGFLYPDTYFFRKQDLNSVLFPQLLIKTAIKNFINKTKDLNGQNPYNLSPYQVLIIASIVEKEERNPQNKPLVADILIRRYLNGWKLGADRTLCYGLKVTSKQCKNYLYNKYLLDKSNPYNTRANQGLPPTPVSNPSLDSIKAVLNPQKNNYWFYLHDKNGKIHFAKTANEHSLNKVRYLNY